MQRGRRTGRGDAGALAMAGVFNLVRVERRRRAAVTGCSVVVAVLAGVLAGALGGGGHILTVVFLGAVALPFVFWRAPAAAVVTLLAGAAVVEQFPYSVGGSGLDAFTDRIPLFGSLSGGLGLSGFMMNPFEMALIVVLLVWLMRGIADRSLGLPHSRLAAAMAVMFGLVALAVVHGLASGGDSRATLWEVRPWLYLMGTYLLASQLLTTRRALLAVLWTFVIGSGFKAAQGVLILYQARNLMPRPEDILAHEEAFFFGLFMILTLGLWIFGLRGRLRVAATLLLPLVVVADLGNYRRTAWLILGADLIVTLLLSYAALPDRRRLLRRLAAGLAVVSVIYFPIFWNATGTLAQPARAVRSAVAPDSRDMQSNQYRKLEDANLGVNILHASPLGTGFGQVIDYSSAAIVDLTNVSFVAYVPHDGILYVWMRMGPPGELALWFIVACAILAGCRASRSRDREVSLLGVLVACAAVAWVIEGYNDMGFFWFRIAIAFGCLLGVLHGRLSGLLLGVVGSDYVRLGREGIPRPGDRDDVVATAPPRSSPESPRAPPPVGPGR